MSRQRGVGWPIWVGKLELERNERGIMASWNNRGHRYLETEGLLGCLRSRTSSFILRTFLIMGWCAQYARN
jgi:hypothetical protein